MKTRVQLLSTLFAASTAAFLFVVPVLAEEVEKEAAKREVPRAIITQDGEVDDMNSLVHMLLYADEIDIQGIILTSSEWHWAGDPTPEKTFDQGMALYLGPDSLKEPVRWPGDEWMYEFIDDYAEVYPNLMKHDANYPTPEYLKSVTKVGNIGYVGDTEEDTEGSNLIKEALLDEDERPLYLTAWGGTNTIARALMTIEEEYKDTEEWDAVREKIVNKAIISAFAQQDQTYMEYIAESWPEIKFIDISGESGYGYFWKNVAFGETREVFGPKWMKENLDVGHGALLDDYVTWGDGTPIPGEGDNSQFGTNTRKLGGTDNLSGTKVYQYEFISEGDSPSFFILMDSGLRNLEDTVLYR